MRRRKQDSNRKFWIILGVIGAIILIVALIIVLRLSFGSKEKDPFVINNTENTAQNDDEVKTEEPPKKQEELEVTIDPSTVATVDVAPIDVQVSYVKGVNGFSFEASRRPNGTRYVEFQNDDLKGTKCTNDKGTFATILVSPTVDDAQTLTKKVTVEGTEYGLALSTDSCTADKELLKKYHDSFSAGFPLLKKISSE